MRSWLTRLDRVNLRNIPRPRRYLTVLLLITIILFLYFTSFPITSETGSNLWRTSSGRSSNTSPNTRFIPPEDVRIIPPIDNVTHRANATLFMLARNSDIDGAEASVLSLENQFNKKHGYPWVFLNEVPFTDDFKLRIQSITQSEVKFGVIPPKDWYQPGWINETLAQMGREELAKLTDPMPVPYADSVSYRNMCRFNSGFFFNHELLRPYKWYWRVEPNVSYSCDVYFDPFVYMIENNKRYSFTISLKELQPTIPSLWDSVKKFLKENPGLISRDNSISFVSSDKGDSYNLCHFWSNFEIADLDFYRSSPYTTFFSFLDQIGGFYYERWGDAPIHSIAASLFLPRSQVHFFEEIGYRHEPFYHCPKGKSHRLGACKCDFVDNMDYQKDSCLRTFENLFPKGKIG